MGSSFIPFISYSSADGSPFATWLWEQFQRDAPRIDPWIDHVKLPGGYSYPSRVAEAIDSCDVLLAVVSRDSVHSKGMERELLRADRYDKQMIPLQFQRDALLPYLLEGRQPIDFSRGRQAGMSRLRQQLDRLMSPQGQLDRLVEELRTAKHELARAGTAQRRRTLRHIERLEERIGQQRQQTAGVAVGPGRRSARRAPHRPGPSGRRRAPARPGTRYIPGLPSVVSSRFLDRKLETEHLDDLLANPSVRLVAICGADGVGKTMMVAKLLKNLGSRRERPAAVLWLRADGAQPVSAAALLASLGQSLPDDTAQVGSLLANADLKVVQKLDAVLELLSDRQVIVVIDNIEHLLDPGSAEFRDAELDRLLRRLVVLGHHRIKVILIGQTEPGPLLRRVPANVERLPMDAGLRPPHAQRLLRRLDKDGMVGLQDAPDAQLVQAAQLVDGRPRALEAIYTVLSHDRNQSLEQLLEEMQEKTTPAQAREHLIATVHGQLDRMERRVVQALAIFGRPVPPAAVDQLLRPYVDGQPAGPVLAQLLEERTIRQDGECYYLPSADRPRVLRSIPRGQPADRDGDLPPLSQLALFHRAAEYFAGQAVRQAEGIDDLTPRLNEIDLRLEAEEYELALRLAHDLDARYLERWGYSQLLVGRLLELVGRLSDPQLEITALDLLASAEPDGGERALDLHSKALVRAESFADAEDLARLHLSLGADFLAGGFVGSATDWYGKALRLARAGNLELEEAYALVGLSHCEAETGRFPQALAHRDQAIEIIRGFTVTDPLDQGPVDTIEVELLLDLGYWYGLLGEPEFALEQLEQGRLLASARDLRMLEGQFAVMTAEVLLDRSDADPTLVRRAIELAGGAVELGEETRNPALLREAYTMLALSQLHAGDLGLARAAADAACHQQISRTSLGAFLLQGTTALRQDDRGDAGVAFRQAHVEAARLRGRDDRSFMVADTDGLALCGLALCGEREHLPEAEAAFRTARGITSERGVVKRTVWLLDAMDPNGLLATARRYATGEP